MFMKTYLILLFATMASVFVSRMCHGSWGLSAVMALATFKFLLVAFSFMDLRHAHFVWQAGISVFSLLFLTAILLFQ